MHSITPFYYFVKGGNLKLWGYFRHSDPDVPRREKFSNGFGDINPRLFFH